MKHSDILLMFEETKNKSSKLAAVKLVNDLMRSCETPKNQYDGLKTSKEIIDNVWHHDMINTYRDPGALGKAILNEIKKVEPILFKRLNFIKKDDFKTKYSY